VQLETRPVQNLLENAPNCRKSSLGPTEKQCMGSKSSGYHKEKILNPLKTGIYQSKRVLRNLYPDFSSEVQIFRKNSSVCCFPGMLMTIAYGKFKFLLRAALVNNYAGVHHKKRRNYRMDWKRIPKRRTPEKITNLPVYGSPAPVRPYIGSSQQEVERVNWSKHRILPWFLACLFDPSLEKTIEGVLHHVAHLSAFMKSTTRKKINRSSKNFTYKTYT